MSDTLAPQAGKRYKLRNGMITGVMKEYEGLAKIGDPDRFYTKEWVDDFAPTWREDGKSTFFEGAGDEDTRYDIVEEYTE